MPSNYRIFKDINQALKELEIKNQRASATLVADLPVQCNSCYSVSNYNQTKRCDYCTTPLRKPIR